MPEKDLATRIDGLNFGVEKSIRYHQRRRGFFETLHSSAMFIVILSGSAAFAELFRQAQIFGLIAAITAAADLTVGFSRRAREHELLHGRFSDLAIDVRQSEEPTEADLKAWQRRRVELEKDEPPTYWALEASCHNEVLQAWGRDRAYAIKVPWYQHVLMNWLRFDRDLLRPKEQRV